MQALHCSDLLKAATRIVAVLGNVNVFGTVETITWEMP